MESRIPLPTDNIFKFYAMFGLLVVIFAIGATLYVNQSTNNVVFEIAVEFETLKADPARTLQQEVRFQILQKKLDVAKSNKNFFLLTLGGIIALGCLMLWYGFRKWHTEIQPIQDEIAQLTLEKLRKELNESDSA